MTLGNVLLVIAFLLALLDLVLRPQWSGDRYRRVSWLTPAAVVLVCVALAVGVTSFVGT